ncbi:MAG: hypothetical protein WC023_13975 [Rhodocyclaceae bacterium]
MICKVALKRSTRALATIGFSVLCMASSAAVPLKIVGFDDMSCQAWGQSKNDSEQRTAYLTWMRGVLTGHNYARPSQQVSAISSGTIEQHVNRYCHENPTGRFDDATFRLSDKFSGRNAAITK